MSEPPKVMLGNGDLPDEHVIPTPVRVHRALSHQMHGATFPPPRRGNRVTHPGARSVLLILVLAALSACGTGSDAVTQGDTFEFVSPRGQTVITYDPPQQRTQIAALSGADLMVDTTVRTTDFAGKVLVINVWGSWCGPCRGEADDLEQVFEETKSLGVDFLGINFRDDRQSARDFVIDRGVEYPSIYDFDGATLAALTTPTSVVPTTVVLDRKHRPAVVYLRSITATELGAVVRRVASEPLSP